VVVRLNAPLCRFEPAENMKPNLSSKGFMDPDEAGKGYAADNEEDLGDAEWVGDDEPDENGSDDDSDDSSTT